MEDASGRWRLTPLAPELAEADFAAFYPIRQRLRQELGWNGWPPDDFDVVANIDDLAKHYAEFERREAYAYSLFSAERCIGCIYIEPWEGGAQLHFWVIDAWLPQEPIILESVLRWLEAWPFDEVIVPVRPQVRRMHDRAAELGLTTCDGPEGFISYRRPPS